jgi:HSP20 family protein
MESVMIALSRWSPFKEMEELQGRLGSWMNLPGRTTTSKEALAVADWSPLVDITEDEKEFLLKAELPGVKREEVKVTVEDGVLTLTGERRFEQEEKEKRYHRIERAYGSFMRSFTLPEGTPADKVAAEFKDGVLLVHLPKALTPKASPMEVKVA